MFECLFCLGCGKHIAQVLKDIPVEERCRCQKPSTAHIIIQTQKNDFSNYDFEI